MQKRKCETCRFFQIAGVAGNGWCTHPKRQMSSDAKILVRKGELACRNGWNQDLWQARVAMGDAGLPVRFTTPPRSAPEVPASEDLIAAAAKASRMPDDVPAASPLTPQSEPAMREDVLVEQTTRSPEPADGTDQDDRSLLLAQDTRNAIRRARERHRARYTGRPRASSAPLLGGETAGDSDPLAAALAPAETDAEADPSNLLNLPNRPRRGPLEPPAPVPRAEANQNDPETSHRPRPDDRFETVPIRRTDFDLPRARRQAREPLIAGPEELGEGGADRETWRNGDDPDDAPQTSYDRVLEQAKRIRAASRAARQVSEPAPPPPLTPSPTMEPSYARRPEPWSAADEAAAEWEPVAEAPTGEWWAATDTAAARWDAEESERRWSYAEAEVPAAIAAPPDAWPLEVDLEAVEDSYATPPPLDLRDLAGFDDELLDMRIAVAPHIPRRCGTCRDFRTAENGERGWCTNKWAFTHRRMVGTAEPPACETSIGCWWMPYDDAWLPHDDPISNRPTPLVDRLMAALHPAEETMLDEGWRRRGS